MFVRLSLVTLILAAASAEETRTPRGRHKYPDPFSLLDHHLSLSLSQDHGLLPQLSSPIFWPWTELAKAAVALDEEEALEEPSVNANKDKYEIKLDVRRFKPQEIKVKVKDRVVLVEGKRIVTDEKTDRRYVANHFLQRYTLPLGVDPEEVIAEIRATGVLVVSAPRHPPPPPTKEREVPLLIEELPVTEDVRPKEPEKKENKETSNPKPEIKEEEPKTVAKPVTPNDSEDQPSDQKRIKEQIAIKEFSDETSNSKEELPTEHSVILETTSNIGKIRKKELEEISKNHEKNETKKASENNELDFVERYLRI